MIKVILIVLLCISVTKSFSNDSITVNNTYTSYTVIAPFNNIGNISSLSLRGYYSFINDTSFIRILLKDARGDLYQVFETFPLCSEIMLYNNNILLSDTAQETKYLRLIEPDSLIIIVSNASVYIENLYYSNNSWTNIDSLEKSNLITIAVCRSNYLNSNITSMGLLWKADTNEYVKLSYKDRANLLNKNIVTKLFGFDFYSGGIFESPPYEISSLVPSSTITSSFDWRNRHGANDSQSPYFDANTFSFPWNNKVYYPVGWVPWKPYGQAHSDCYAFGPKFTLEIVLNLYYNKHIDLILNALQVRNCGWDHNLNPTCKDGNSALAILQYMQNNGIIEEGTYQNTCGHYLFTPNNLDCDCGNPPLCSDPPFTNIPNVIKINSYGSLNTLSNVKQKLITNGPLVFAGSINGNWWHSMSIIGYHTVGVGDTIWLCMYTSGQCPYIIINEGSPYIGHTYWVFRDSNKWLDNTYGDEGFIYILDNSISPSSSFYYINTPLSNIGSSPDPQMNSIACNDYDNDGYCWWGIGEVKPNNCPECSELRDCDDNDPNVGPYDETYACSHICDFFDEDNPIIINSNTTLDKDHYYNRNIVIKDGATLEIRSTLSFASEAKIIVEPGCVLHLNGGKLTSGCDGLWKGVEVHGDYSEDQTPSTNQGLIWITKRGDLHIGTIENASCAILVGEENGKISLNGGIVRASDALFLNNKVSVEFGEYKFTNLSYFHNCTFSTTEDVLLGQIPPEYFMVLRGVEGIKIKGCLFENTSNTPFNGCGIYSFDAHFDLDHLCLDQIVPCENFLQSEFNNLGRGVTALGGGASRYISVQNTLFNNVYSGLYISAINYAKILSNTFDVPESDQGGNWSYGLYLDGASDYHVEANHFHGYNDVYGNLGIYVLNSGPIYNCIYNNFFDNLSQGIVADGENRDYIYEGLCIKCNDFSANENDILVIPDGAPQGTNSDNLGIAYNQGTLYQNDTAPAGNTFSDWNQLIYCIDNCYGCKPIIYIYHGSNGSQSRINPHPDICNVTSVPNYYATYNKTASCPSHIDEGTTNTEEEMAIMENTLIEKNNLESYYNTIVDGGNTLQITSDIFNSTPQESYDLHQELLSISPYLSDTALKSAVQKENVLSNVMIRDILVENPQSVKNEEILDYIDQRSIPMPEYMMNQILNGYNVLGTKEQIEIQLATYNTKIREANYSIIVKYLYDTNGQAVMDTLKNYLINSLILANKYYLCRQYLTNSDTANATQTLNSIENNFFLSGDSLQELQQYINYLSYIKASMSDSLGALHLDINDINMLLELYQDSTTLPGIFARNTLVASGILNYLEPTNIPEQLKKASILPIPTNPTKIIKLNIYPTPCDKYVIVEYNIPNYLLSSSHINIVDLNGRTLLSAEIKNEVDQILLPTINIKNGQYFVILTTLNGISGSSRIIVIHP